MSVCLYCMSVHLCVHVTCHLFLVKVLLQKDESEDAVTLWTKPVGTVTPMINWRFQPALQ